MEAQSRESRVEPDYFETLPGPICTLGRAR